MSKKSDVKTCRYSHCQHKGEAIDIATDNYVQENSSYFHKDCYKNRQNIQLIKNLWYDHISNTVVVSQLIGILNQLIFKNNISSDYLVFVIEYCIEHGKPLRYPPGIRYCVDNEEIKKAYKEKLRLSYKTNISDFKITERNDEPKFNVNKGSSGFGDILK